MNWWSVGRLVPFVVLGLGFGWFLPQTALWQIFLGVAVVFVAWVLVHAAGGAAWARLVGFRPLLVRVGPLAAIATTAGWAVLLTPVRSISGFEYEARLAAPIGVDGLRWRMVALELAGPALFAVLAAALFAAAALRSSSVLAFIAVEAVALVFDQLVPWPRRRGSRATPGWWLWSWLRRPRATAQRTAMFMLWLQLVLRHGLRPGQVHQRWVELVAGDARDATSGEDAEGSRLAYFCALDHGQIATAAAHIGRSMTWKGSAGTPSAPAAVIEAAFLAARYQNDVSGAERLLADRIAVINAGLADDLARAQAAIHLAQGRYAEALECCSAALEPVPVRLPPDIDLLRRTQGTGEPTGGHGVFHRDQVRAIQAAASAALEVG